MTSGLQQDRALSKLEVSSFPRPLSVPRGLCFPSKSFLLRISSLRWLGSFWLRFRSTGVVAPSFCPTACLKHCCVTSRTPRLFFFIYYTVRSQRGREVCWLCYKSICGLLTEFVNGIFDANWCLPSPSELTTFMSNSTLKLFTPIVAFGLYLHTRPGRVHSSCE